MNEVFDLNRWLLLVGKHWSENRKKYLLSLVAIAGILLIWFSFMMLVEPAWPMQPLQQAVTYFVGLYLAGCLYGSMLFADLADGPKGIHYISLPASTLEKLLTALLYGVILFFIAYSVIFYLVDYPMTKIANSVSANFQKNSEFPVTGGGAEIVNVFQISANEYLHPYSLVLRLYFPIQSAFILGSVYFPKFSFIKTSISLLIVFLFLVFFIGKAMHGLLPYGNYYESLTAYRLQGGYEEGKIIKLPDWINKVVTFLFYYAFAPIFWVVTYFRLKEKEI